MHENKFKSDFLHELLRYLLMKYERSKAFLTGVPSSKRPQFQLNGNNPFAEDLQNEMDYRKREWMIEVITDLEQEGVISTSRDKFNSNKIKRIYLEPDRIEDAYGIASVTPLTEKLERMKEVIKPLLHHEWEWIVKWAQLAIQSFDQKKTYGLSVDEPRVYEDVVKVLQLVAEMEGNIPIRNLSNKLFNDSKHFERKVASTFISVLKKALDIEFESDEDMLAFFGIVKRGRLVRICGNISWRKEEGGHVSISSFIGGVGLSDATVETIGDITLVADRVIFIENLTSYEQWIDQRLYENEAVIYTGGYPHKTLQHFLGKLSCTINPNIPIYHWGDIDIGGVLIFNYIKMHYFDSLKPLFMDIQTLKQLKEYTIPITSSNRETINKMLADNRYFEWKPLFQALLDTGFKLEQESIFDVSEVSFDDGVSFDSN